MRLLALALQVGRRDRIRQQLVRDQLCRVMPVFGHKICAPLSSNLLSVGPGGLAGLGPPVALRRNDVLAVEILRLSDQAVDQAPLAHCVTGNHGHAVGILVGRPIVKIGATSNLL